MNVTMGNCWNCDGRGWVGTGDIEDGMMTGRAGCSKCDGRGKISADALIEHIAALTNNFRGE